MQRKIIVLLTALIVGVGITATAAQAERWVPGTAVYVTHSDVEGVVESSFDHAYCTGLARFGHRDGKFVVFDCDVELGAEICTGFRYKALKTTPRHYWRLKQLRYGNCDN